MTKPTVLQPINTQNPLIEKQIHELIENQKQLMSDHSDRKLADKIGNLSGLLGLGVGLMIFITIPEATMAEILPTTAIGIWISQISGKTFYIPINHFYERKFQRYLDLITSKMRKKKGNKIALERLLALKNEMESVPDFPSANISNDELQKSITKLPESFVKISIVQSELLPHSPIYMPSGSYLRQASQIIEAIPVDPEMVQVAENSTPSTISSSL